MSRASDIIIMEAVPSGHVKEYEQEAEKSIDQNYYCFCPFGFAALSSGRWLSSNGTLYDPISGDRL